jgi:hypothetical protein
MASLKPELETAQLALEQARSEAGLLQTKLTHSEEEQSKAAQAHHAELKDAHEALKGALETIAQLKAQQETAAQAEQKAEAAQERFQRDQAAISELKARAEAAERASREAARATAALEEQLEQSNRDLKQRLVATEQLQARVAELEAQLRSARDQLPSRAEAQEISAAVPAPDEEPAAPKTRAPKRAKARRDDQLRLFGTDTAPAAPNGNEDTTPGATTSTEPVAPPGNPAEQPPPAPEETEDQELPQDVSHSSSQRPQPGQEPENVTVEAGSDSERHPRERAHRLPPAPPIDPAQFRKAFNQILPLLTDRDPGAKDCLKDNRRTFRSAFAPEVYSEFEDLVKDGQFEAALEELKKAARKHGIPF